MTCVLPDTSRALASVTRASMRAVMSRADSPGGTGISSSARPDASSRASPCAVWSPPYQ